MTMNPQEMNEFLFEWDELHPNIPVEFLTAEEAIEAAEGVGFEISTYWHETPPYVGLEEEGYKWRTAVRNSLGQRVGFLYARFG